MSRLDYDPSLKYDNWENVSLLLPEYDDLSDWQQCMYDGMKRQWELQEKTGSFYKHTSDHAGVLEDVYSYGRRVARTHQTGHYTYCVGVTYHLFHLAWKEWMGEDFEGDIDFGKNFSWKVLRAHFFSYRDEQDRYLMGGPGAFPVLEARLKEVWDAGKVDGDDPFEEGFGAEFYMHSDPYKARFGDIISMQPHENPHKGGHACVFVSLEKRWHSKSKQMKDIVRVWNTHPYNRYGMKSGCGLRWYWVDRKDKAGFQRILRFGGLKETD